MEAYKIEHLNKSYADKEIFNDRFYIELQNHGIPEELASHDILIKLFSNILFNTQFLLSKA